MATLTSAITANDRLIGVTDGPTDQRVGSFVRIEDEVIAFEGYHVDSTRWPYATDTTRWRVRRGLNNSLAVAHDADTAIESAADAFLSDAIESPPSPFDIPEGSPARVFYGADDPGAVGAGAIWLRQKPSGLSMMIRNAGDTEWLVPKLAAWFDDGGSGRHTGELSVGDNQVGITAKGDTGVPEAAFQLNGLEGAVVLSLGTDMEQVLFAAIVPSGSDTPLFMFDGLPSTDPEVAGALFTAGAPGPADPKALMVSGGASQ